MAIMNKQRCLALMARTPVTLQGVLNGVDSNRARSARDGADGWSVVEIMCHLRDFDGYYQLRSQMMLEQDNPQLPAYDHEAIARDARYQEQELAAVLNAYLASRRSYVALISSLDDTHLDRPGIHPEAGQITVLDQALRSVTHDIDHTEQIVRTLGLATRF